MPLARAGIIVAVKQNARRRGSDQRAARKMSNGVEVKVVTYVQSPSITFLSQRKNLHLPGSIRRAARQVAIVSFFFGP